MPVNKLEIYQKQLNDIKKRREKLQYSLIYRHNLTGTKGNVKAILTGIRYNLASLNYDRYLRQEGRLQREIASIESKKK